jgi:HTH-type transcriptional regulator/antitoxin HipB
MIKNDRQLKVAQKKMKSLEADLACLAGQPAAHSHARMLSRTRADVAEYLDIKRGGIKKFPFDDLAELPDLLIKARIAAGITQKELAERLRVTEQMVQKDEAGAYESAGFDRIVEAIDALGYSLVGCLKPSAEVLAETLVSGLGFKAQVPGATEESRGRAIAFVESR